MSTKLRLTILIGIFSAVFYLFSLVIHTNFEKVANDEAAYMVYVTTIKDQGIQGFRKIVDWYSASEEHRFHPAPTRLGFILPLVLLFKFIPISYLAVSIFSFSAYVLFLLISFFYSNKFFGKDIALSFCMLLSASPLMMAMGRTALTDSLTNLLWGASVWLFLDYTRNQQLKSYWALVLVLSWSLLVREITIFLIIFFVLAAFIYKIRYRGSFTLAKIITLVIVPAGVAFCTYYLMLGMDIGYCLKMIHSIYLTHFKDQANPYATVLSSGPWFRYIIDFMLLAPAVTIFAIGYIFKLVLEWKDLAWEKCFFLLYLVIMMLFLNLFPHSKVVRFAINLDMVLCLFAVFMVYEIFKEHIKKDSFIEFFLTLTILFTLSFSGFYHIFVIWGRIPDPISENLLKTQKFIRATEVLPGQQSGSALSNCFNNGKL